MRGVVTNREGAGAAPVAEDFDILRPIRPVVPRPLDPWRPFDEPDISKRIDPFRPPRPPAPRPGGSVSPPTLGRVPIVGSAPARG